MDKVRAWVEATQKYFREVRGELKKVVWPDHRQTLTLTMVVVVASALVGSIIWVFDFLVSSVMKLLV